MQEQEPRQQSGCNVAAPLNCCNCINTSRDWLPNNTPVHLTKIDLDETSSNDDLFGEANIAELPCKSHNSIDAESEEKSKLNSNENSLDSDGQLPPNLNGVGHGARSNNAELDLLAHHMELNMIKLHDKTDVPQSSIEFHRKTCHDIIRSEHIDPSNGCALLARASVVCLNVAAGLK